MPGDLSNKLSLEKAIRNLRNFHKRSQNTHIADTIQFLLLNREVEERRRKKPKFYEKVLGLHKRKKYSDRKRKKSNSWDVEGVGPLRYKFSRLQDPDSPKRETKYKGFIRPDLDHLNTCELGFVIQDDVVAKQGMNPPRKRSKDDRNASQATKLMNEARVSTEDESDSDDIIMGDPLPSSPEPTASDVDELPEDEIAKQSRQSNQLTAADIVDIEQRLGAKEHVLREMRRQILASITIEDVAPFLPKPQINDLPPLPISSFPSRASLAEALKPFQHLFN